MIEMPRSQARECPFLQPTMASRSELLGIGVYCRLPSGRARIPSRDEVARFCAAGKFRECPVYRRARYLEADLVGLA